MEKYRQKLKERINDIIRKLKSINTFQQNNGINTIITRYAQAYMLLDSDKPLINNPVKGSVRAYLDVFSDYENPVLAEMYDVEKEIDIYLSNCKKEMSP